MIKRVSKLVSVVVPTYNAEAYIEKCLDGLSQQTYKHVELVIVDDASQDGTVEVITRWLKKDSRFSPAGRVHFVALPRNIGTAGAYTTAMYLAIGEYIAVHDCDDYSHTERFERQVRFLRDNPQVSVLGTNYQVFKNDDPEFRQISDWLAYGNQIDANYKKGLHCVANPTLLFRGKVFDAIGGHTRKVKGAEDFEWMTRCIVEGYKAENLKDILYYYRSHPAQHSRNFYK